MARPTIKDPKTKVAGAKLTDSEMKKVQNMARIAGLSVSEFLFEKVFNGQVIEKNEFVLPQPYLKEFTLFGSNLNQMARVMNSVPGYLWTDDDKKQIKKTQDMLFKIFELVSFKK